MKEKRYLMATVVSPFILAVFMTCVSLVRGSGPSNSLPIKFAAFYFILLGAYLFVGLPASLVMSRFKVDTLLNFLIAGAIVGAFLPIVSEYLLPSSEPQSSVGQLAVVTTGFATLGIIAAAVYWAILNGKTPNQAL